MAAITFGRMWALREFVTVINEHYDTTSEELCSQVSVMLRNVHVIERGQAPKIVGAENILIS